MLFVNETVSTQTHDIVTKATTGTQHLCITCAIYQNINFQCPNVMSGEKNETLLVMIWLAYIPLIITINCPVCLLHYWSVDLAVLIPQALIILIRTSLGQLSASDFSFYQIISHDDVASPKLSYLLTSSAASNELWQLFNSAEVLGNFKFCSLFRRPFLTPIMHSRLNVKERGRDLICWRLPPISVKRLLIDNGKGERWTLNRHSNYRL